MEYLYQKPIVTVRDIILPLNMSKPTANSLIKEFEEKGILTGFERNKLFVFERYLEIYSKS